MKIVYCAEYAPAKIMDINDDFNLKAMQNLVGGYIETYYPPYCDGETLNYVIVCNEEGKYNGMEPNRMLLDKDDLPVEIIYGPFFICKDGEEDFEGFTDEEAQKVRNLYDPAVIKLKAL